MIQTALQWSTFKASPIWPCSLSPHQPPLSSCSSGSSHTGLFMLPQASSWPHQGLLLLSPHLFLQVTRRPNSLTPFRSLFVFTLVIEAFDYSIENDRMGPILPPFFFKHYFSSQHLPLPKTPCLLFTCLLPLFCIRLQAARARLCILIPTLSRYWKLTFKSSKP